MNTVKIDLEQLRTGHSAQDLQRRARVLGLQPSSKRKSDLVMALARALSDKDVVRRHFENLVPMEREVVAYIVRCNNDYEFEGIEDIVKKHGKTANRYYGYWTLERLLSANSRALAFFIGETIPEPTLSLLKTILPPVQISYTPATDAALGSGLYMLAIRENFTQDVMNMLRLIDKKNLRITKVGRIPNKATAKKLSQVLIEPESPDGGNKPQSIPVIQARTYPLVALLQAAELVQADGDVLVLGDHLDKFLRMSTVEKCRFLWDIYVKSKGMWEYYSILDTIERIYCQEGVASKARAILTKHLRLCPINEWVSFSLLLENIRATDPGLLSGTTVAVRMDGYTEYLSGWSVRESWFIESALTLFFCTLGVVDIMYVPGHETLRFFRLTPLGAVILGVDTAEQLIFEEKEDADIIVQPNFELMISEGKNKDALRLFLDRCAEDCTQSHTPMYKLTFKSVAAAMDQGISLGEIRSFLQNHTRHPLPENVVATLEEWEQHSNNIRIRTVTIMETSDPLLLEELKSYKPIRRLVESDLSNAVVVATENARKLKRECEKKHFFCQTDDKK